MDKSIQTNKSKGKEAYAYFRFYLLQSWREMKRNKCSFCWGILGCFLVSLIIPIVLGLATKLPELNYSINIPSYTTPDMLIAPKPQTDAMGLNFTHAKEILDPLGKEKQYDIGWRWNLDAIPKGKVVFDGPIYNSLLMKPGDTIKVNMNISRISPIAFDVVKKYSPGNLKDIAKLLGKLTVPFELAEVHDSIDQTSASAKIVAEFDSVWEHIVDNFPLSVLDVVAKEHFLEANLSDYASQMACTCQLPRNKTYLHADSSMVQRKLNLWSTGVLFALGSVELDASLPMAPESDAMFESLLLLLMGVLVVVLLGVTVLIIYSQIQRSVDGRAYELGLMRVHGMGRCGVVMLVVMQGLMYAVPGIVVGVAGAQGINAVLVGAITKNRGIELGVALPAWSVVVTILVVLGATLVASFFPIRTALSANLHDSIDVQHTNASAVLVTIERSDSVHPSYALLVDGAILVVIGGCVYVFFPLSLESGNVAMLVVVLIGLMICIMVALVLLCVNFEYVFEAVVCTVFLFWEKSAVKKMALKNLSLHRLRNRGTTVMFALILCFVFFMDVIANTVLSAIKASGYQQYGCDLDVRPLAYASTFPFEKYENWNGSVFFPPPLFHRNVTSRGFRMENLESIQKVLDEYSDVVESYAFASCLLAGQQRGGGASVLLTNRGRTHQEEYELIALSPNFRAATDEAHVACGWVAE
ncbi:uncharacterized protein MONOS_17629 [Monocercomonoides exilis]|uniref:uncharacterized protein n=1 Tax=Monocercomonoides exilis TaxID=2049356 RepID=UPI0035598F64|nr:hypothetical protein MONOS_17629 [Monocercomonoides exilis]